MTKIPQQRKGSFTDSILWTLPHIIYLCFLLGASFGSFLYWFFGVVPLFQEITCLLHGHHRHLRRHGRRHLRNLRHLVEGGPAGRLGAASETCFVSHAVCVACAVSCWHKLAMGHCQIAFFHDTSKSMTWRLTSNKIQTPQYPTTPQTCEIHPTKG